MDNPTLKLFEEIVNNPDIREMTLEQITGWTKPIQDQDEQEIREYAFFLSQKLAGFYNFLSFKIGLPPGVDRLGHKPEWEATPEYRQGYNNALLDILSVVTNWRVLGKDFENDS